MIVIAIEGIVGVGKTTLLKKCLVPMLTERGFRVTLVDEPVSKWNDDGLLKLFYDNPKRYAYHFQTKAFHDRVKECQTQYEKYGDVTDIFLLERSVFSDTLFMKALYEQNLITDLEMKHYGEWWELWESVMPFKPDLFVYLKPSLYVCMDRVKERARDGEEGVSKEYQSILEKKHDELFENGKVEVGKGSYADVIELKTDENFRDEREIKHKIANLIEEKIKIIQSSRKK